MSVFHNNALIGASGQGAGPGPGPGGYEIERSVRFNRPDSPYLSRTPSVTSNRKTWTWAGWVKRSEFTQTQFLFYAYSGDSDSGNFQFRFQPSSSTLRVRFYNNANAYTSSAVFRDASAWYHVVLAVDTTQAASADRIKLYINGVLADQLSGTAPSQNADLAVNDSAAIHTIGISALAVVGSSNSDCLDGYLADVQFIDGLALDPTSFGEFDGNGIWQPIEYTNPYSVGTVQFAYNASSTAMDLSLIHI